MDAEFGRLLEQQKLDKLEQVKKEAAWEEEKCQIMLDKLQSRYFRVKPHYVRHT